MERVRCNTELFNNWIMFNQSNFFGGYFSSHICDALAHFYYCLVIPI